MAKFMGPFSEQEKNQVLKDLKQAAAYSAKSWRLLGCVVHARYLRTKRQQAVAGLLWRAFGIAPYYLDYDIQRANQVRYFFRRFVRYSQSSRAIFVREKAESVPKSEHGTISYVPPASREVHILDTYFDDSNASQRASVLIHEFVHVCFQNSMDGDAHPGISAGGKVRRPAMSLDTYFKRRRKYRALHIRFRRAIKNAYCYEYVVGRLFGISPIKSTSHEMAGSAISAVAPGKSKNRPRGGSRRRGSVRGNSTSGQSRRGRLPR